MESLFDIDEQILKLISLDESDLIDPETGEVLVDVYEELDKLSIKREEKLIHIGRYADALTRESELLKDKASTLSTRAKSKQAKADRLKAYVQDSMLKLGTKKVEDDTVTIKLNTTKVVRVVDESKIPKEYLNTIVETKPDKRKILAELKSGKQIAGCELSENNSVTIK